MRVRLIPLSLLTVLGVDSIKQPKVKRLTTGHTHNKTSFFHWAVVTPVKILREDWSEF
jgi:hypothetical protein